MGQASGKAIRASAAAKPLDWRKRMGDHVAYALLVYTGLQIFVTAMALKSAAGSILPYFALVVLVFGIIPACRMIERRWDVMGDADAADPAHASAFRRDTALLWAGAIGLPLALTAGFKAFISLI